MDAATVTYENVLLDLEDFPDTTEPIWLLGQRYNICTEKKEMLADIRSRLWFTYRKNFPSIGGTGPTSDSGWGCMLRCGQMVLAQALLLLHLGREWRWKEGLKQPAAYYRVLHCFLDQKDCLYSIHQIAQMGVGEGKAVGQWYGPNTVAQVLRKLSLFDDWSSLAVHVAMDNTVVFEDIRTLCLTSSNKPQEHKPCERYSEQGASYRSSWRPLLLLVPLRLGLTDVNKAYISSLKACLTSPYSLGFIGGRPNSAHYFIGFVGEELLFLDPHTVQPAVDVNDDEMMSEAEEMGNADCSYHCMHPPCRMDVSQLDPSIALGFYCCTEHDFDSWCEHIRMVTCGNQLPMFELVTTRPKHWPPFVLPSGPSDQAGGADFTAIEKPFERFYDSDEEFEILHL
uniref:cysteine protease ATG4B isoform X2 n=1 Tax=Myxine glutinosa TaxID=7769 RepID=UPI00358E21D8